MSSWITGKRPTWTRYLEVSTDRRRQDFPGGKHMKQILIDVRTREEFIMEHIKGAVNIPHYDLAYYGELLRDREVVVYCNTGRRTAIFF
ncbi:MAG: hypothetical protein E4H23_11405 [Chrysiogenales bacterium]|nr:MAG: hypothetical protein E4H23_11405 [Chrysiogenales bacterium]